MSMHVDNVNHAGCNTVRTSEQTTTEKSPEDAVQEALQQWIMKLILEGFKGLGKTQDTDDDAKGGQDVSENGPLPLDTLNALAGNSLADADKTIAQGEDILTKLFGSDLAEDKSIYFDQGVNDPDLVKLFGGELPLTSTTNGTPSSSATSDRGEPDAVITGGTPAPSANAEEAEETEAPAPIQTGEYSPTFGVDGGGEDISIYGLAALVLLTTMENKRNIVANRLDQIESTNNRVQEITNTISNLKAEKSDLDKDSATKAVDASTITVIIENSLGPTGELDLENAQEFLSDLKLDGDFVDLFKRDDNGKLTLNQDKLDQLNADGQTIELSKAQIDAVIEKLTSQSEALSTQNQTRNIKLQQQISELQVTTQMTSAIIDQIKTLGSGIAQRL